MGKLIFSILLVLGAMTLVRAEDDRKIPEMPVYSYFAPKVDRVGKMNAPKVAEIKVDTVATLEKPFKDAAWENNRKMSEEIVEIRLGVMF